jgi:hypothetical protein
LGQLLQPVFAGGLRLNDARAGLAAHRMGRAEKFLRSGAAPGVSASLPASRRPPQSAVSHAAMVMTHNLKELAVGRGRRDRSTTPQAQKHAAPTAAHPDSLQHLLDLSRARATSPTSRSTPLAGKNFERTAALWCGSWYCTTPRPVVAAQTADVEYRRRFRTASGGVAVAALSCSRRIRASRTGWQTPGLGADTCAGMRFTRHSSRWTRRSIPA